MKLLVNAKVVKATVDAKFADMPVGHACLRLPNDVVVEPRFAMLHDYQIVEATSAERDMLRRAGYDLADTKPSSSGTAGVQRRRGRQSRHACDTDHS